MTNVLEIQLDSVTLRQAQDLAFTRGITLDELITQLVQKEIEKE